MLLFVMIMFSILAVPAFAQTGEAQRVRQLGGNHFWFRDRHCSRVGGAGPGACRVGGMRSARTQSGGADWHSGGADSGLAFIESLVLFTLVIIFVKVA